MSFVVYALLVIIAYLLGAIPFGLIVGLHKGIDIRQVGSGNTGATNTLRAIGWKGSAIVLLLDLVKAVIPILVARWFFGEPVVEAMCGLAAVIGHNWSIYIGFRGGKGVSSSLGVMLLLSPVATLVGAVIVIPLIALTRYVSLGSVMGAVLIPAFTLGLSVFVSPVSWAYIIVSFVLGIMILVQHRGNIQRLLAGNERKLGHKAERLETLRQS